MKNVLFLGGSSLLATIWSNHWKGKFNIIMTQHHQEIEDNEIKIIRLKEISQSTVKTVLSSYQIDILINCIGLTSVEQCEANPIKANFLNAEVPLILAKICRKERTRLVHISTDHLFDGILRSRTEIDKPSPLNHYAKTKLKGDENVISNNPESLIIRTNFFGFGPKHKPSFSDKIIQALENKKKINLFSDVFFSPIHVNELAKVTNKLLNLKKSGIFNVSGNERISKYEFGKLIAEKKGISKDFIEKGFISQRKDLVIRPKDMSLSNLKVKNIPEIKINSLKTQINEFI
tara:strand:+ start:11503 stop:12372 length:870 start_codon:yes stop_codon:yes gene_type:complete